MRRTIYWIAAFFLVGLVLAKFSPQSGFTSLIRFGDGWKSRQLSALQALPVATVADSSGYDGQFYAQIALDPLLRDPGLVQSLDAPAYRARRILAPATAALLGLGNPWWTLQAYALINVVCWLALGWILRRRIGDHDWQGVARWVGCMFSLGILDSVRQSLVDLPALLFLVLAVGSSAGPQFRVSNLWLVLGGLTKETSLLGALALRAQRPVNRTEWKRLVLSLSLAVLPLLIWSCYVHARFNDPSGYTALGNFSWPFVGLLAQAQLSLAAISSGNYDGRYTFSLIALLGLTVQCWVLWRIPDRSSPWWRIGAVYSVLLLFLSFWVWSGYWAVCRAVLPLTMAFNLLLPANRWFWPLWIVGNLTALHGVWRFL